MAYSMTRMFQSILAKSFIDTTDFDYSCPPLMERARQSDFLPQIVCSRFKATNFHSERGQANGLSAPNPIFFRNI